MTSKTWNGGTARFLDPDAWTPVGAPVSGDLLLMDPDYYPSLKISRLLVCKCSSDMTNFRLIRCQN